jgi:RNA polymerase sigma factor (sigma-70 family)
MASGSSAALQRELNKLFDAGTMTGLTDRDLIERFSGPREAAAEAAFEVLVTRHGPMVLRVCRNALRHADDADDAFQATFLVLVKQRGSIRKLDSVASWLYGVAARVSARARVDAARRRRTEERGIRLASESVDQAEAEESLEQENFGPIVQEEVRRLPEKYQSVVLLCYWEGLTHEQAAQQLGCPIGTVRSRIARARNLLRRKLLRRGLASTAGALAGVLVPEAARASSLRPVPPHLVRSSVQAAMRVAAGQATAEVVSAGVATMVRRILWRAAIMKLKSLAVALIVTGFVLLGARLWAQPRRDDGVGHRQAPSASRTVAHKDDQKGPQGRAGLAHIIGPPDLLLVEVLEALPGRPISGERLVRPDGTISLGFYGDVEVAGLTIPEAKEKIVTHLRKSLSDESLGLVLTDPETGEPKTDKEGRSILLEAKDTNRVFVDVTAYNSRNYYVEGEVSAPGRLPFTGGERVLDVIHFAGGVLRTADTSKIKLIRSYPKGSPVQVLPIDYEEVTMGTDPSTNYQILPSDRIVVPRSSSAAGWPAKPAADAAGSIPVQSQSGGAAQRFGNRDAPNLYYPAAGTDRRDESGRSENSKLEKRMKEVEKKLDTILEWLKRFQPPAQAGRRTRRGDQVPTPLDERAAPERSSQPR